MGQRGQIYPIQIRTIEPGRFRLVNGAHRIAAARKLGWTHIEAFLVDDLEEEEFRLLEIDENLCRAELDPVDRAHFFATRQGDFTSVCIQKPSTAETAKPWITRTISSGKNCHLIQKATTPPKSALLHLSTTPRLQPGGHPALFASTPVSGSGSNPQLREALSGTPVGRRLNDLERIADMDADKQHDLLHRVFRTPNGRRSPSPLSRPTPTDRPLLPGRTWTGWTPFGRKRPQSIETNSCSAIAPRPRKASA